MSYSDAATGRKSKLAYVSHEVICYEMKFTLLYIINKSNINIFFIPYARWYYVNITFFVTKYELTSLFNVSIREMKNVD